MRKTAFIRKAEREIEREREREREIATFEILPQ